MKRIVCRRMRSESKRCCVLFARPPRPWRRCVQRCCRCRRLCCVLLACEVSVFCLTRSCASSEIRHMPTPASRISVCAGQCPPGLSLPSCRSWHGRLASVPSCRGSVSVPRHAHDCLAFATPAFFPRWTLDRVHALLEPLHGHTSGSGLPNSWGGVDVDGGWTATCIGQSCAARVVWIHVPWWPFGVLGAHLAEKSSSQSRLRA